MLTGEDETELADALWVRGLEPEREPEPKLEPEPEPVPMLDVPLANALKR